MQISAAVSQDQVVTVFARLIPRISSPSLVFTLTPVGSKKECLLLEVALFGSKILLRKYDAEFVPAADKSGQHLRREHSLVARAASAFAQNVFSPATASPATTSFAVA